ncbi:hypothetical protein [Pinisolibacter sp.]|uniref:hypothetical protein n=1 Tax=Pinisolibacter sp. TaxID=2172024 RepID=UPI002FDCE5D6
MPRRNRVTPFGTLEAVPERGRLLGNRGDLHAHDGSIRHDYHSTETRWITCRLSHGLLDPIVFDTPGRYTPLFFADEAVALAAGHRPCASCRRPAFLRYAAAWQRSRGQDEDVTPRVAEIDGTLAEARFADGVRRSHRRRLGDLPDGVFFTREGAAHRPLLRWRGGARPWSHGGYGPAEEVHPDEEVMVLTPEPTVAVLAAGYEPEVVIDLC